VTGKLQWLLFAALLVGLWIMLIAIAIWPARTEQQRRLRHALMHGLAGDDGP
jgi:ubiquinone biosynthesis protein Coq4